MKNLPYTVFHNGTQVAAFANEIEACTYTRRVSGLFESFTEVVLTRGKGRGLIAQYDMGKTSLAIVIIRSELFPFSDLVAPHRAHGFLVIFQPIIH